MVDELRVAISLEDVKEAAAKVKELMTMDSDDPYAALGGFREFTANLDFEVTLRDDVS